MQLIFKHVQIGHIGRMRKPFSCQIKPGQLCQSVGSSSNLTGLLPTSALVYLQVIYNHWHILGWFFPMFLACLHIHSTILPFCRAGRDTGALQADSTDQTSEISTNFFFIK